MEGGVPPEVVLVAEDRASCLPGIEPGKAFGVFSGLIVDVGEDVDAEARRGFFGEDALGPLELRRSGAAPGVSLRAEHSKRQSPRCLRASSSFKAWARSRSP